MRGNIDFNLVAKGGRILTHEGIRSFIVKYRDYKKKIKTNAQKDSPSETKIDLSFLKEQNPRYDDISFPSGHHSVEVSVIIPVHNNLNYTINSLRTLSQKTKGLYEVIVVDDASTDNSPEIISKITGVHYIRNNEMAGFPKSCNMGVASCNGRFIVFLMNYCLVTDNWLEPLVELSNTKNIGAIGSKLINSDGKLLEAGGVVWNDATLFSYGAGDNPERPEYNFVREVDYCSGDALFVKKDSYEKINGFDEGFKTMNFGSMDICFSLKELGYKVFYNPKFKIIQLEELLIKGDADIGTKERKKTDLELFKKKWGAVLLKKHPVKNPFNIMAVKTRSNAKKILVIDRYVPNFDKDAGSYRMYNILKILVDLGFNVTFIGNNFCRNYPYDSILQQEGIEVIYSPFITSIEHYLSQSGPGFNVVIVSRPDYMIKYESTIRKYCPGAKIIYDTVDLRDRKSVV